MTVCFSSQAHLVLFLQRLAYLYCFTVDGEWAYQWADRYGDFWICDSLRVNWRRALQHLNLNIFFHCNLFSHKATVRANKISKTFAEGQIWNFIIGFTLAVVGAWVETERLIGNELESHAQLIVYWLKLWFRQVIKITIYLCFIMRSWIFHKGKISAQRNMNEKLCSHLWCLLD